ncbi:MAG: protein kinase [Candidatus Sericytochromatia bacterium]|nr:protein kinase [Candidatus Sericytochromatia bacterium]
MVSLQHYQKLLPAYQIEKELGEGGFSQTLLARRAADQQPCVLKVLSLKRSQDWKAVELFEREAKVLRHLDHPGIPDFYDSFNLSQENESLFFLAQEYLPGQSLQEWVSTGRRYTEAQVMTMARQLTEILVYLQSFSPPVIHRDIKPSNIMLNQDQVWLIDFGAVKDSLQQVQGRGSTVVGTFGYMPLEQYEGRAQPASDIYGLGMSLLYALSGTEPVQMKKRGLKTDFRQHLKVSEGLARILDRMIEPDIALRYPDAHTLQQDLQRLSAASAAPPPSDQSQRGAILLIALLIIAGGLITAWLQHQKRPGSVTVNAVENSQLTYNSDFPDPWQAAAAALPERVRTLHSQDETLWFSDSSHVYALQQDQLQQWDAENLLGSQTYLGFRLTGDGKGGAYALGKSQDDKFVLNYLNESQQTRIPLPGAGSYEALIRYGNTLLLGNGPRLWQYTPDTQQWHLLTTLPDRYSRQPEIRALLVHQDQIWLAADSQLWQLHNKTLKARWEGEDYTHHLAAGPDGRIWLGSREGLHVFDPERNSAKKMYDKAEIEALIVDPSNSVWAGTRDRGLLHWTPENQRWQVMGWREGLPDDHVQALALQGEILWMALDSAAPHQTRLAPLKTRLNQGFDIPEIPARRYANACEAASQQPAGEQVQTFAFRGQTHVFFNGELVCPQGKAAINAAGTAAFYDYTQGVIRSSGTGQQLLGRPPGMARYTSARDIWIDPQGHVWLSFYRDGIFRHNGSWQRINTPEAFQPVFGGSGDQVWLGRNSSEGPQLLLYQNQQLKDLKLNDRFLTVQQVLGRPDGGVAIASTQGLFVLNAQQQAQQFNRNSGLPGDYISRITQTPDGLWLSVGKGLSWLSWPGGNTRQITSREGLFSDRIRQLAIDSQQNLWLQDPHGEVAIYQQADLR